MKKSKIKIIILPIKDTSAKYTLILSEKALETDWNKPEEEKAWKSLQMDRYLLKNESYH